MANKMKSIGKLLALTMKILFVIGVILLFGLKIFDQDSIEGVSSLSHFFEQQKLMFTFFRVALLTVVFWQWNVLINGLAKIHDWENEMRLTLIDAHWKILIWFVIFEIVINQNLMGYVLN